MLMLIAEELCTLLEHMTAARQLVESMASVMLANAGSAFTNIATMQGMECCCNEMYLCVCLPFCVGLNFCV